MIGLSAGGERAGDADVPDVDAKAPVYACTLKAEKDGKARAALGRVEALEDTVRGELT